MMKKEAKLVKSKTELKKWEQKLESPLPKYYFPVIVGFLCLIRLMDEFASSSGNSVQSWIINEFYVQGKGMTYEAGLSQFSLISTASMMVAIITLFYIALSDRFGRKKLLAVSIMGMTLGLFLCAVSVNLPMYILGYCILFFFTSTDIHQLYIMEIAPDNKRATYISLTTTFGCIGTMLIALVRMAFTIDGVLLWRNVYFAPCIVGIVATIGIILFARETKPFMKSRIKHLRNMYDIPTENPNVEQSHKKTDQQTNDSEQGIAAAFRYIFKVKQVRRVFLTGLPNGLAMMAFAYYYESIMTQSGMSASEVSSALFIYPLAMAIIAFLAGRAADKYGRRPTCIVLSVMALGGLVAFVLTAQSGINPYIVGICFGVALSSYYRFGDILGLTLMELLPTSIRASSSVCRGVFSLVITLIGSVVCSILVGHFKVSTVCLVWGCVIQSITALMFFFMAKETKGIQLD